MIQNDGAGTGPIMPQDEEALAEAVREAGGPLLVRGGGTRTIGHPVVGEVLSTTGLRGITLYEPGALTLAARAGTPLSEIEACLAAEGQCLPFDPPRLGAILGVEGESTIGGVVAANASGPRAVRVGLCRDFMLGVRFVDGHGQILRSGGRVMKNVTGYDLVKLMTGARGTLGVLTEVTFKVLPAPETETTLLLGPLGPAAAIEAMSDALATPWEVSGAARLPDGRVALRLEGFEHQLRRRTGLVSERLARHGSIDAVSDPAASAELWASVRDVSPLAACPGDLWRITARVGEMVRILERLEGAPALLDWGGALAWVALPEGTDPRPLLQGLRWQGMVVRAAPALRRRLPPILPEKSPARALEAKLRHAFDPRGILNPGLIG